MRWVSPTCRRGPGNEVDARLVVINYRIRALESISLEISVETMGAFNSLPSLKPFLNVEHSFGFHVSRDQPNIVSFRKTDRSGDH